MHVAPIPTVATALGRFVFPFAASTCGRSDRHGRFHFGIGAALLAAVVSLGPASAQDGRPRPITGRAIAYELSVPVYRLPTGKASDAPVVARPRINPLAGEPDRGQRGTWTRGRAPLDPLVSRSQNPQGRTPGLDLRFSGTGNPLGCGGCSPPDTTGDVGRDHYVQVVNATKVAIYTKTGARKGPPFNLGNLWSSGICSGNAGDPNVLYDELADRWLLAQFASPNHLCIAVSQTRSARGAYHLFTFNVGSFPDYFKVGVWSNGYYVSANEATYTAYAFDRKKMLVGNPTASFVKFTGETNFLMPADVDGPMKPKGSGLFYTFKDDTFHGGSDRIEIFRLTPNFVTPASSTFTLIKTIPIASFAYTVCGFFQLNCVRQMGTAQKVDVVSEWPMQRLAYRRFAGHEALVGNFTVGGGAGQTGAAIRWFELRMTTGNWKLFQEGTHDPGDGHDRFMGSIAMDQKGNIALGYSVTSSGMFPSVRYVMRRPKDPLGTMGHEKTLRSGRGSQTGSSRWGDYSAMSVDPVTGCQFWYTNEFYQVSAATAWKTIIGAFTHPSCP